jgi:hypothetical protein
MAVQIDQVVARFSYTVVDMTAPPATPTLNPAARRFYNGIFKAVRMMHLCNNRSAGIDI